MIKKYKKNNTEHKKKLLPYYRAKKKITTEHKKNFSPAAR